MARPILPQTRTLPSLPPTFSNLFIFSLNAPVRVRCGGRTVHGSDIDDDDLSEVTPWGACSCAVGNPGTDACINKYYKDVDALRELRLPPEIFNAVEKEYRNNLSKCLCVNCTVFCGWKIPDNQIPPRVVNTRTTA